jgi:hypothetical protein
VRHLPGRAIDIATKDQLRPINRTAAAIQAIIAAKPGWLFNCGRARQASALATPVMLMALVTVTATFCVVLRPSFAVTTTSYGHCSHRLCWRFKVRRKQQTSAAHLLSLMLNGPASAPEEAGVTGSPSGNQLLSTVTLSSVFCSRHGSQRRNYGRNIIDVRDGDNDWLLHSNFTIARANNNFIPIVGVASLAPQSGAGDKCQGAMVGCECEACGIGAAYNGNVIHAFSSMCQRPWLYKRQRKCFLVWSQLLLHTT